MPGHGALDRLAVAEADRAGQALALAATEPPNRYERRRPGELVHVDVKKLGPNPDPWASRDRQPQRVAHVALVVGNDGRYLGTVGWEFVHVCVDDATRLAYAEVLATSEDQLRPRSSDAPAAGSRRSGSP